MKATEEQMQQLGGLIARCEVERVLGDTDQADRVLAGLLAAACILLPRKQWAALVLQAELDSHRLRQLAALVPNSVPPAAEPENTTTTADFIEA